MKSIAGKKRLLSVWFTVCSLGLGLSYSGCANPPSVDSNTNWLRSCDATAECGSELSCMCGICTKPCTVGDECSDSGGVCLESDTLNGEVCGDSFAGGVSSEPSAICLQGCHTDEDCGESSTCIQGACVREPQIELSALTWPPPELEETQTIALPTSPGLIELDPLLDYVLSSDAPISGEVQIRGGRNVTLQGLEINVETFKTTERRILSVEDNVGIVHIEGVSLRGNRALEGLFINSPGGVVQIQNVRIDGIGAESTEAVSEVQPSIMKVLSASEIRVDGLSGSTEHHGLVFQPSAEDSLGAVRLQRVDLRSTSDQGVLFLMESADAYTLIDCFARLPSTRTDGLGSAVWPDATAPAPATCFIGENAEGEETASWPDIEAPPLDGSVTNASPASGTFVPTGLIGLDYESPGYQ